MAMAEQALVDARTELEHKKIVDANPFKHAPSP
jgi:hypothetical protein